MDELLERHFAACNNAVIPGARTKLNIGRATIGYVMPSVARLFGDFGGVSTTDDAVTIAADAAAELPRMSEAIAKCGFGRIRGEMFDVRADPDGRALSTVDRGMLPTLGVAAAGVHVNGLVRRADGIEVWVARRARTKLLDPGKLDHIVAGGISAGMDARATLLKEGAEEAGLPAALALKAVQTGVISYAMDRDGGLRRESLFCFDLDLPDDFIPSAEDGEVECFELWPVGRLLDAVRHTDDVKFNVNLVLIDLFRRIGMI